MLASAESLFRQFGIKRVRVEEICRRAGIGKATFYKHFENRGAIALAVLDSLVSRLRADYERQIFGQQPFAQRLQRLLSLKREGVEALGPALLTDLLEAPLPEIQVWLQNEQAKSYDLAMRFLREGQAAGSLNPDFKPDYLLYLLDVAQGMFNDPRFKALYPDVLSRTDMLNQFLLFGLSAVPEQTASALHEPALRESEGQHGG